MKNLLNFETPIYSQPIALVIENKSDKPRRVKLFSENDAAFEPEGLMIYKFGLTDNEKPYSIENHKAYLDLIKCFQKQRILIGKSSLQIILGPHLMHNLDLFCVYIKYKNSCNRQIKCVERVMFFSPSQFRSDCMDTFFGIDEKGESDFEIGQDLEYFTFILPPLQKVIYLFYPSTAMPPERNIVVVQASPQKKKSPNRPKRKK